MPVVKTRSVLSGMHVKEAMRRQVVSVRHDTSAHRGVARLIKHKADILLITDDGGAPAGAVSKTDLTGAYYAGVPVETALGEIMMAPLITCYPDDPLESALAVMSANGVHQLFVRGAEAGLIEGLLTYADILGLVYRYCRRCRRSHARGGENASAETLTQETLVAEVMTQRVVDCGADQDLVQVMEILSMERTSAILVKEGGGQPAGVISKTDLVMAWHRGVDANAPARSIMSAPVRTCHRRTTLTQAMARMLIEDMGRIFVHDPDPAAIVGVLALADAASHRSGTCRACVSSRLL